MGFREVIVLAMQRLEFLTGLKQMNDYTKEQKTELANALTDCAKEFKWLTVGSLEYLIKHGMSGKYGEFYHLNVKTLTGWINSYYKNNEQRINQEILRSSPDVEKSPEEIEYWIQVGKKMFIDCWELAKKGEIRPLVEWLPPSYTKFVDNGMLIEDKYKFDEDHERKMLKLEAGFGFSQSVLVSRKKDAVWRQFVRDMINQNIDLTEFI